MIACDQCHRTQAPDERHWIVVTQPMQSAAHVNRLDFCAWLCLRHWLAAAGTDVNTLRQAEQVPA